MISPQSLHVSFPFQIYSKSQSIVLYFYRSKVTGLLFVFLVCSVIVGLPEMTHFFSLSTVVVYYLHDLNGLFLKFRR